ncbi:MAG: hypothetical protein SO253_06195 [Bacilli bacterium]|nr:hypothetical protein [Bacilli bacterium]
MEIKEIEINNIKILIGFTGKEKSINERRSVLETALNVIKIRALIKGTI